MMDRSPSLNMLLHMLAYRLAAPAKLNLYLEVLGRNPAGFHDLETIFQTISLADELLVQVQTGSGTSLSISDTSPGAADRAPLSSGADNLICQAVEAYRGLRPHLGQVHIELRKRIPCGAGLGGGSSDAAATLRALAQLDPEPPHREQLHELAAKLGADVAFFMYGGTAYAKGRGEDLTPLPDLPQQELTLLLPGLHCATPAVFAELSDAERGPRQARGPAAVIAALSQEAHRNRLAAPCLRLYPALATLADFTSSSPLPGGMSGSGSSFYLLHTQDATLPDVLSLPCQFRCAADLDRLDL